MFVILCYQRIS